MNLLFAAFFNCSPELKTCRARQARVKNLISVILQLFSCLSPKKMEPRLSVKVKVSTADKEKLTKCC